MAQRTQPPARNLEDRDRTIIQLRSEVRGLKEYQASIPMLLHTKRELQESLSLLSQDMSMLAEDMAFQQEASQRMVGELKGELESLKNELRRADTSKSEAKSNYSLLKQRMEKGNAEVERLMKHSDELSSQNELKASETARLIRSHDSLSMESNQLVEEVKALTRELSELNGRHSEIKKHLTTLQAVNKGMYDQIVNYEEVNNRMEDQKEEANQQEMNKTSDARRKDEHLKGQLGNLFELEARRERLIGLIEQKNHLRQLELSKQNELLSHISTSVVDLETEQKIKGELEQHIQSDHRQAEELGRENNKVRQTNDQLVRDLEGCKEHLENLLSNNEMLTAQLDKFCEDDEFIKRVITVRKRLDPSLSRIGN